MNWADFDHDSDDDPQSNEGRSGSFSDWSSEAHTPNGYAQAVSQENALALQEPPQHERRQGTKKKLQNKSLSRNELAFQSESSRSESSSALDGSSSGVFSSGIATATPSTSMDALPSLGAALHDTGGCSPCLFVLTMAGCVNGAECSFCHLSHKGKSHSRPNKSKRDRFKKLIQRQSDSALSGSASGDGNRVLDVSGSEDGSAGSDRNALPVPLARGAGQSAKLSL